MKLKGKEFFMKTIDSLLKKRQQLDDKIREARAREKLGNQFLADLQKTVPDLLEAYRQDPERTMTRIRTTLRLDQPAFSATPGD